MNTGRYHHGDLPSTLRVATAELIAERGPTGFSLREVARRAEVSHAAPAHHFGDSRGLLTSVAAEGFANLVAAFEAALDGLTDPVEQLNAMGKAYVNTALGFPGHFGVMCSSELINEDNEAFIEASTAAYQQLLDVIAAIGESHNPDLDVDAAATMTWSAVHGLATLHAALPGVAEKTDTRVGTLDQTIESFTRLLMGGFAAR